MDKKRTFGIFILATFMLILFSTQLVSSFSTLWTGYSNNVSYNTQAQVSTTSSNFQGTNKTLVEINNGYTQFTGWQPIITDFLDGSGERYIIFLNGAGMWIYDRQLNFIDLESISSPSYIPQVSIGDYNNDGLKNEIAGLFIINQSTNEFRVYNYNLFALNLTLLYNYTWTNLNTTGNGDNNVKCIDGSGGYCVYMLSSTVNNKFVKHFFNGTIISSNVTSFSLQHSDPFSIGDFDNDGQTDYYIFSPWSSTGFIFNSQGQNTINISANGDASVPYFPDGAGTEAQIVNSYMTKTDTSPFDTCTFDTTSYYLNGSIAWTKNALSSGTTCTNIYNGGLAIADDDLDGKEDVWVAFEWHYIPSPYTILYELYLGYVYRGTDGLQLENPTFINGDFAVIGNVAIKQRDTANHFFTSQFTIARMNSDPYYDWILTTNSWGLYVFSSGGTMFYNASRLTGAGNTNQYSTICVTADLDLDSYNDIVCSGNSVTSVVIANFTNNNSVINSVIFNPSLTIGVNQPLNITVNCLDNENDTIYYRLKCDSSSPFSSESISNVFSCSYASSGTKYVTTECRDSYHGNYDSFTQAVTVSGNQTQTIGGSNGTLVIPVQLVDLNNQEVGHEQGFLPEIYYGILAFLSYSFIPFFILIFIIFVVLIVSLIGRIIKKIAHG